MKARGRHRDKVLSAVQLKRLAPGRHADGNGLYLVVEESGARRWLLRTVVQGRRRDLGLGSLSVASLADARQRAAEYRRLARDGGDPTAEKHRRAKVPTFEAAARAVHAERLPTWRNAKHGDQWINTLAAHAFPGLGRMTVDAVGAPDVLRVLAPIWLAKPETARRVRQRIGAVMDWAAAAGHRNGVNPVDGIEKGLPKQPDRKQHHAALAYVEVPAFLATVREASATNAVGLALEFLVLTAARTSEVVGARWSEIDLEEAVWTIPGERMKAGRDHRVPLSVRCLEILKAARKLDAESPYLFPGRGSTQPLSNMAMLMMLRRANSDITAHGFRSSFRDWASERTNFTRDVCEMALAHTVRDKTEAAYRRGDLLEKRRELMETWAQFAGARPAKVVRLRAK